MQRVLQTHPDVVILSLFCGRQMLGAGLEAREGERSPRLSLQVHELGKDLSSLKIASCIACEWTRI